MGAIAFRTLGGEGPDAVLIHGYGADRLSWLGTSPALMPFAKVHALDLPGHGDSDADAGDGTPKTLVQNLSDVLAENGIARAHLIGHSLGGGLALLMAAEDPQHVASLSLIAPAGLGRGIDREFLTAFPDIDTPERAMSLMQRLVARPQLINKLTVQRVLGQLDRPGVRDALRITGEQLAQHEEALARAADAVAQTGIPRLTLWGEHDLINPSDTIRCEAFGGEFHIIPASGHLPHIEAPKVLNGHLVSFLQRHLRS